ncbi:MAG: ORF6N domain-containing protein [Saprospirales bacterium]|nr:ORF6N domain-containing protein [Saprospirales bacterium]
MELQLIRQKIYEVRGQKVMLDFDLAALYEVETRALNQAVKRNLHRFPEDFMFQLSQNEWNNLISQIVISSWGGTRKLPFAFTEQGVAMLSSVLRSEKAIQVNIAIMRAFVEFRRYALTYTELAQKIAELETRFEREFADVHEVLRWLGEENQTRADEIAALQTENPRVDDWQNRPRIGFKKETESVND